MSQITGTPSVDEQPLAVALQLSTSETADPASSLRAAALLTLKSKRRKLPPDHLTTQPLSRPVNDDPSVVHLDYGQEDPVLPAVAPTQPDPPPTPSAFPVTSEADAVQVREEGEISDSEDDSPMRLEAPTVPIREEHLKRYPSPPKKSPTISTGKALPPTLVERIGQPQQSPTPTDRDRSVSAQPSMRPKIDSLHNPYNLLGENCVRPGLAMTQAQYDTAKDIVLDLLGWGVPPEYLVDCGLSREIVFYVFSELNLRLPLNFDTSGLLPYPPTPEDLSFLGIATNTQAQAIGKSHSSTRSPGSSNGSTMVPYTHPSLPAKPSQQRNSMPPSVQEISPILSKSSTTSPTQSSVSGLAPGTSLHDIEQQRRQELLARKAVQASRKPKFTIATESNHTPGPSSGLSRPPSTIEVRNQDVQMVSAVPSETVDDFLNSISPVTTEADSARGRAPATTALSPSNITHRLQQQTFGSSDMDVDEEIPGFINVGMDMSTFSPATNSPLVSASFPNMISPDSTGPPPSSAGSAVPPTSAESDASSNATSTFPASDLVVHDTAPDPPRRGTKRPVAADFVDFESRSHPNNGYTNGQSNPMLRRRMPGSFASVSGMRRCVIDLSDSEDDGEMIEARYSPETERGRGWTYSPFPYASHSSSKSSMPIPQAGKTPPPSNLAASVGPMSPAALVEKEEEIRRMRELIAQREEENRLKKLAAVSGRNTPLSMSTTVMTAPGSASSINEEQEDVLSPAKAAVSNYRPVPANGHATVDIVMEGHSTSDISQPSGGPLPVPATANARRFASASPPIDLTDTDTTTFEIRDDAVEESVLTAEARQEQVMDTNRHLVSRQVDGPPGVDVSAVGVESLASSSTQQIQQEARSRDEFAAYDSPLDLYPLLRSRSRRMLPGGSQHSTHSFGSTRFYSSIPMHLSTTSLPSPDLKPLRQYTMIKRLDPNKEICKYEVPGGGVCRDENCQDAHLSRAGADAESNDEDTARYLYGAMRGEWHRIEDIQAALRDARERGKMGLEERVRQALATLRLSR